jgi:DNA mismatch endonuclease (patch repair protein)
MRLMAAVSWASSEGTRRSMLGNTGRDTKPELAVRRLLHARGYRYRVDYRPIREVRSRADVAFTRRKIAVFIDGCFWHVCPIHATHPKANADYWAPKLARNVERDAETTVKLQAAGWTVLRYWEHEAPADVAAAIEAALRSEPHV